jgi:hypothetical protein
MKDILFAALTLAFFAASWLLVYACDHLMEDRP